MATGGRDYGGPQDSSGACLSLQLCHELCDFGGSFSAPGLCHRPPPLDGDRATGLWLGRHGLVGVTGANPVAAELLPGRVISTRSVSA